MSWDQVNKWRKEQPEKWAATRQRYKENLDKDPKRKRELLDRVKVKKLMEKLEAIEAYGGKCQCCGESRIEFLAFDHVNGGGAEHRRQCPTAKGHMPRLLKQQGYPEGYRLLCHNCNFAIHFHGKCPHEVERGKQ